MKKFLLVLLMCVTFALTVGLAACGGSSSGSAASSASASASASSSAEDAAKAEYDHAVALFDEGKFYSAKAAFEKSGYKDWEQRAAACVQPMPETGELSHDENMRSDKMILVFNVNEENGDMGRYITVLTKDNKLVESLFVKGAGTVETGIPGGEYYVKSSSGTEWYGADEQFGPDGLYITMVFNETEGDPNLTTLNEGFRYDITINNVTGEGQGVASEETGWDKRA